MSEQDNNNNNNIYENNKSTHEDPFANQSKNSQFDPFEQVPETGTVIPNQDQSNQNQEEKEEKEIKEDDENNMKNPYEDINNNLNENDLKNPYEDFKDNSNENNNQENNIINNNNDLPSFDNFQQQNNFNNNVNDNNNNNDMNQIKNNQANNFNLNPYEVTPQNNINPYPNYTNNNNNNNNNNFNNNNNNNNNNPKNSKDYNKIKEIILKCESLYKEARVNYDNYQIKKAIDGLIYIIKKLDGLKQFIENKLKEFSSMLNYISTLRNKAFKDLQNYRLTIYQLIPKRFTPVMYNQKDSLHDFIKRYILSEPFVSFDEIFDSNTDNNKKLKNVIFSLYERSQKLDYKNLLLFGPKGSGKTLAVHALANLIKGKVVQIEGVELFKIPNFSLELVRTAFSFEPKRPLIIYIRYIEKMFSNMNNFNFIYDKVCSTKLKNGINVIIIVSTTIIDNQLPKQVSEKFHYTYCIRPCEKNMKINYIKFIANKIGININMNDNDLNGFVYQYLSNYSNEDIFNLIVAAIDLKKNEINLENVYKSGINGEDLYKALNIIKGSLTPDVMRNYYL